MTPVRIGFIFVTEIIAGAQRNFERTVIGKQRPARIRSQWVIISIISGAKKAVIGFVFQPVTVGNFNRRTAFPAANYPAKE